MVDECLRCIAGVTKVVAIESLGGENLCMSVLVR